MDHALDIALVILMTLFTIRGFLRGMIKELSGFVGIILGFFISSRYYPLISPYLTPYIGDQQLLVIVSYLIVFLAVLLFINLIGMAVSKFMSVTLGNGINIILGGVTGFGKGSLVSCVVLTLLVHFVGSNTSFMKNSYLAAHFNEIWTIGRKLLPPLY